MIFFLHRTIYLLPIFLMVVSFLSSIIRFFGYKFNFVLWGNIGGFSLITDVLFFYIFYYGKYCLFTKFLSIGLFLVNLVNIFGVYFPEYYKDWYEIVIFSVLLCSYGIYELNKQIE